MKKSILALLFFLPLAVFSQKLSEDQLKQWQHLDFKKDSVFGTSTNRTYNELLQGRKGKTVIVAVLDTGVDINHEDLKGKIWKNSKEIAGNGIDDDNNGYIDDIHGWNFLGGANGKTMSISSTEADREYFRLKDSYSKTKDNSKLKNDQNYRYFLEVEKEYLTNKYMRNAGGEPRFVLLFKLFSKAAAHFTKLTHKDSVSYSDIKNTSDKSPETKQMMKDLAEMSLYFDGALDEVPLKILAEEMKEESEARKQNQQYYNQLGDDPYRLRKEIVGDNPFDINDKHYGNSSVGDES